MIDWLVNIDKDLFLFLNGLNHPLIDPIMVFITGKYSGIPIYALILFWLFKKYDIKTALIAIAAIVLTFAVTEQVSVFIKYAVQRPRPGWEPSLEGYVRLLEYKGGQYGFVSSHASNVFGMAIISMKLLKNKYFTWFILFWATIVSYSRIYVGKHYPLDIICGTILGIASGYLIYRLFLFCISKLKKHSQKNPQV